LRDPPTPLALGESDFASLEDFELQYRWTDPRHAVWRKDVLAAIRPLTLGKAAAVNDYLVRVFTKSGNGSSREFDPSRLRDVQSSTSDEHRGHWLRSLGLADDVQVIVSWDLRLCVAARFGLVSQRCDDLFYPGSDDAFIAPTDLSWLLVYHHWEQFQFGYVDRVRLAAQL
jgi:hypothetical protein